MKIFAIIVILTLIHTGWTKETKENKTFVASKEWQEIPEGQGVPAGLHIRINLQTGKKEAKILEETHDDDEEIDDEIQALKGGLSDKEAALTVVSDTKSTSADSKEKSNQLKHLDEAMQRIGIGYTPEEKLENIKREYRSYEDLKKSFEGMRKNFKTDAEIIKQLIEEFHNTTTSLDIKDPEVRIKTLKQILESFNYLMSQFDNALMFVDQGGLDQVLLPVLINQTHIGLKVEAMRVLGAMSQNNPRVQIKVYERNVGSHLTQILMTSTKTEELSSALYAFSTLLRKFPHAQQRLLSTSGTQALVSVLAKECELKIKAKAATIIGDIIVEKELVLSKSSATDDPLAAAQYAELSFPEWLQANSYCETMDTLVTASLYEFLEAADILEYFVNSLENTRSLCSPLWSQSPQLRHILLTLKNRYSQSQDEYRLEVAQLLVNLIEKLYPDPVIHDEF